MGSIFLVATSCSVPGPLGWSGRRPAARAGEDASTKKAPKTRSKALVGPSRARRPDARVLTVVRGRLDGSLGERGHRRKRATRPTRGDERNEGRTATGMMGGRGVRRVARLQRCWRAVLCVAANQKNDSRRVSAGTCGLTILAQFPDSLEGHRPAEERARDIGERRSSSSNRLGRSIPETSSFTFHATKAAHDSRCFLFTKMDRVAVLPRKAPPLVRVPALPPLTGRRRKGELGPEKKVWCGRAGGGQRRD